MYVFKVRVARSTNSAASETEEGFFLSSDDALERRG